MKDYRPAVLFVSALVCIMGLNVGLSVAAADHAFSHRMVIVGRAVDELGSPVSGLHLDLAMLDMPSLGDCVPRNDSATEALGIVLTRNVTDADGMFTFCNHMHDLPRSVAQHAVILHNGSALAEVTMDTVVRWQFVGVRVAHDIHSPQLPPVRPRAIVVGRVFELGTAKGDVDGIPVFGQVRANATISLITNGSRSPQVTKTSAYGDFSAWTNETAVVEVALGTHREAVPIDAAYEVGVATIQLPPEPDLPLATFVTSGLTIVGAGTVLAVGAWVLFRRRPEGKPKPRAR